MTKISKPYPESIAAGGYEILYRCRECGYSFRLADDEFNYCPHCGVKLDWGVVVTANKEWKDEFLKAIEPHYENPNWVPNAARDKMLANLDALNQTITNGKRHEMRKTQATKDDITYRNICYFLGNGWTKEELIKEGFFTEEDFEIYEREKQKKCLNS